MQKFTQQEIDHVKETSCLEYLASRGYKPKNSQGRTWKFLAPWRHENTPSVHIYKESNTFVDFADKSKSGSVVQLCMATEGVSFGKALEILQGGKLPERNILPPKIEESPIKILYTSEITSAWLCQYLASRYVPLPIARKYCVQARIALKNDKGEEYRKTCIAFPNAYGGFEFRSAKAKLSNSPKWWSVVNPGHDVLRLFEGFMDYLSFVAMFGDSDKVTSIILNSIGFITHVDFKPYNMIHYLCDADEAGDKWFEKVPEPKLDRRQLFYPKKDINEYLMWIKSKQSTMYDKEIKKLL